MEARMANPAMVLPGVMEGINKLNKAVRATGVPEETLDLVHMRASQINGCSACVHMSIGGHGTTSTDKLIAVSAWYESPLFDEAQRAALALTEAATRIADRPGAVTDEIWAQATKHYDEQQLSAIILMISLTNFFNRINTTIHQPPVDSWG